jgi:hypothetical protein
LNAQSWTIRSKRGQVRERRLASGSGIEMVVPTEVLAAQNPIPWLGAPLEASISGLRKAELKMGRAALGAHESQEGALTESREQNLSVSDED